MSGHTPGPWSVYVEEDGTLDDCVASMNESAGTGDIVCLAPSHGGWEESHKRWPENARLIAAAPELLEACELLLAAYGELHAAWDLGECDGSIRARAAIAKATGAQA